MKTITIEDPAEAFKAITSEFPSLTMHSVWFSGEPQEFIVAAWSRDPRGNLGKSIQCADKSLEKALEDFRQKVAEHDPLAEVKATVAKLGLKLVPA